MYDEIRPTENTELSKAIVQSTESKSVINKNGSKLVNILEGLTFPADEVTILLFLMQKPSNGKNYSYLQKTDIPEFWESINLYEIENLIPILQNNLSDDYQYNSRYDIEKKAGLLQEE